MARVQTPAYSDNDATRVRTYRAWARWGYETMASMIVMAIVLMNVTPALWSTIELPVMAIFAMVVLVSGICQLSSQVLAKSLPA